MKRVAVTRGGTAITPGYVRLLVGLAKRRGLSRERLREHWAYRADELERMAAWAESNGKASVHLWEYARMFRTFLDVDVGAVNLKR